jgi:hypothetical protein
MNSNRYIVQFLKKASSMLSFAAVRNTDLYEWFDFSFGTMGVCILLRVYQIKSLDKPSFATSIARVLYFMRSFMFTTCFGPDQRPSSSAPE